MAITTRDGVLAGMRPAEDFFKIGAAMEAASVRHSLFYTAGGAAAAPTPGVGGAALTTYAGQIPWTNPVSGNSYLARLCASATQVGKLLVCDRLWHNSGLSATLTTSQTVNSVAWPARDRDGSTNGQGLMCAVEFSAVGGVSSGTLTLGYTNQAGTAGKTITQVPNTTPAAGTFEIWPLAAGDTGIRSIQTYQASATRTSGTFHLVVFRVLARASLPLVNVGVDLDALKLGFPRLYDNTVPFLVWQASSTTAVTIDGSLAVSQG